MRAVLGCSVVSQASLCLPLTACWSFLPPSACPFNPRTWRQPCGFSSASRQKFELLLLSGPIIREEHVLAAITVLPDTFLRASWPLKEQNPWERNPERNSRKWKTQNKISSGLYFWNKLVCYDGFSLYWQSRFSTTIKSPCGFHILLLGLKCSLLKFCFV